MNSWIRGRFSPEFHRFFKNNWPSILFLSLMFVPNKYFSNILAGIVFLSLSVGITLFRQMRREILDLQLEVAGSRAASEVLGRYIVSQRPNFLIDRNIFALPFGIRAIAELSVPGQLTSEDAIIRDIDARKDQRIFEKWKWNKEAISSLREDKNSEGSDLWLDYVESNKKDRELISADLQLLINRIPKEANFLGWSDIHELPDWAKTCDDTYAFLRWAIPKMEREVKTVEDTAGGELIPIGMTPEFGRLKKRFVEHGKSPA